MVTRIQSSLGEGKHRWKVAGIGSYHGLPSPCLANMILNHGQGCPWYIKIHSLYGILFWLPGARASFCLFIFLSKHGRGRRCSIAPHPLPATRWSARHESGQTDLSSGRVGASSDGEGPFRITIDEQGFTNDEVMSSRSQASSCDLLHKPTTIGRGTCHPALNVAVASSRSDRAPFLPYPEGIKACSRR